MKSINLPILLWSASNALKFRISRDYIGYHRVWCSQIFEGATVSRYAIGSSAAASSDPAQIYRALHRDVSSNDTHSDAIRRQKESLLGLALKLRADGKVSDDIAAEMTTIINRAQVSDWRPLLYAIPYSSVAERVQRVPASEWAGLEPEFIIPDLMEHEFHVIEPMPCR